MADRSNARLNNEIWSYIRQWEGTIRGQCIRNMWENGTCYESICEEIGININDYEED